MAHAAATVSATPDPLDFGDTVVLTAKAGGTALDTTQNVTVTIALDTTGDCPQFVLTNPPTPTTQVTITTSNTFPVSATFTPTSNGMKTCTATVKQVSNGNTVGTFMVKGNGTTPQITVMPTNKQLAFGTIDVGFASGMQTVTATNSGNAPLVISSASFTSGGADYTVMGPTSATLLPTDPAVTWMIACRPSTKDARGGTFRISSNAVSNNNVDITLSCTGNLGVIDADKTTLVFDRVLRGTTKQLTFSLGNSGNAAVTGITVAIDPPTVLGYAVDMTTPVPGALNAGDTNKTVNINFAPQDKTYGGPATITLTGTWGSARTATKVINITGTEASFAVTAGGPTLDFGTFRFDAHPQKSFSVRNDGNAMLSMMAPFTPDTGTMLTEYKLEFTKSNVATGSTVSLMPDEQFVVTVSAQANNRIGLLTGHIDVLPDIPDPAPPRLTLTGKATSAFVSAPDSVDFGLVDINGPSPTKTITIMNTGDGTLDVMSFTMMGATPESVASSPFKIMLPGTPSRLGPGETLDIPVIYSPTVATAADAKDVLVLTAELSGAVSGGAAVRITGEAVFTEAHGSGGCNTAASGRGGLLLGLAVLVLRRRRRRGLTLVAAAAILMLPLAPGVRADGISLAVFEPTPTTTGAGFALQSPEVGANGSWVTNAVVSYASNPLVLDADKLTVPVERSTLMQLGVAYALLGRLELGAHIPLYQQSGEGTQAAKGMARGNLTLHAKARLWSGAAGPGRLGVGAGVSGTVPTASKGQYTGSDQPEVRGLALAAFSPSALGSRLTLTLNAGYVFRKRSKFENIEPGSGAVWGAGASVRILDELWATAEVFGQSTPSAVRKPTDPLMGPPSGTLTQVEALAGVTIKPDRRVAVGLAFGRGVTNAIGTPDLRGVVSLSVVPGASPIAPIHGFEPTGSDIDSDGDGIPDRLDKCPNEPEDKDMFEDQDGCPDPDNDHDGIPDEKDKCPLDPEDKDGFQDADGCPDKDNDGDGIPDAADKCPNEPEDKDGFEDLDGCPDPDNDHDGIPDEKDKCPNEPETINGIQDDDGCPDKGDSTIVLSPDRIETLDPITFTGVKLTPASTPLIEQVGATLRAHPEIVRLRITVHVQPTRDTEADQARSEKRAQAVRDWLVKWGVAPARLEARGFGGNKPLVPPEQKGAAKLNDRLELIILERN